MRKVVGTWRAPTGRSIVVCEDGSVYMLAETGRLDERGLPIHEWIQQTPVPGTVAASRYFEQTGKGREAVGG